MSNEILSADRVTASEQRPTVEASGGLLRQDYQDEDTELRRLHNERVGIENDTLKENRTIRKWLMILLTFMSFGWLFFTGVVICYITFWKCSLSDVVATAFITTSLATVLGLCAIGLRYFFALDIQRLPADIRRKQK